MVMALLVAHGIFAQPGGPPHMRRGQTPEQLETLRIWKMTEFLDLSEEQATRFFPAFRNHREKMGQLDSAVADLQGSIGDQLGQNGVDQKYVDQKRKELSDLRQQQLKEEIRFLEELPEYLTPDQQAKFIIFDRRFRRALRDAVRRHDMQPFNQ